LSFGLCFGLGGGRLGSLILSLRLGRQLRARPLLPPTEEAAENAALDAQRVGRGELDVGHVGLAVFGVVDVAVPSLPTPTVRSAGTHFDQDRDAERGTSPQGRIGILAITARRFFPSHHAP